MRNFLKPSKVSSIGRSIWSLAALCVAWFATTAHSQVLFSDNFSRTNDPAPITPWLEPGTVSSTWEITGGTMQGTVPVANNYGIVYLTNSFTNYSVQAQMRFTSSNAFGGGIGGYVNTTTGAHYAAWLYPENSAGGGPAIRLVKFSAWTAFGYEGTNFAFMAQTNVASVGTNLHTVRLAFTNSSIQVFYDGNPVLNTTDGEATPYTNGALSFDMFEDTSAYNINFANYVVAVDSTTPLAVADSYNATSGTTLTVAAPGVLINDTDGVGPLTAVSPTSAGHGTATLNTNGGFTYTPTAGFSGVDTFTYKANDGHTSSAAATVTINVAADIPPVANNDSYTLIGNTTLTVSAPGVLVNDTDTDNQPLTAIVVTSPTNGLLTLTNNGSFGYVPTNNFSGTDTFTYKANDGISNSTPATVTLNVLPTSTLFIDSFQRTTLPPWVVQTGNWLISGGALVSDLNSSYGFAYLTNIWTNYTVQGQVAFSPNSYGGGIGARLTSATGTHYAAWIYPEGSPGGGPALRLVKFSNYTTFGYPAPDNNFGFMAQTNLASVGTGFHTIKMALYNNQIAVYLDGTQMFSVTDTDATTYPTGGISADMFAGSTSDDYSLENVIVGGVANNDSYTVLGGNTLNVAAPGVLANDTPVFTTSLTASQVTGPSHGSLTLNANGSFTYTPAGGFSGQDSFTYQANDGSTNIGTATVNINVIFNGPSSLVFSENFDEVTAPALPSGWTTTKTGVESNAITITNFDNTAPNSAFMPDVPNIGTSQLVTPTIALPSGPSQLTFLNRYNLENNTTTNTDGFDGGVLEIKIGAGAFTDVITAGGSFLAGGYNAVIDSAFGNSLAGRAAWSGNSSGFITTTVDLPPAAAGQSIQLRWLLGTDNGNVASGTPGWWIDTVSISNCPTSVCWNTAPVLPQQSTNFTINELVPLTVTNTATDTDSPVQTLTYSLLNPPSGATIGLHTGIITWTPAQTQSPSTNTFTTKVTDNGSPALSATNSFQVFVTEVNVAPTLTNQPARTNFGLANFSITNAATETNIHAVTTGYGLSGQPTGMTITSSGVITWSPQASQIPGSYTISTVASNKDSFDLVNPILTATNSFVLTAAAVHNGPTLPNIGAQTVNELITLTITNTASDLDVPVLPLTYFLTNSSPANASISANGVITWQPQQNQSPGVVTITTVVTDGSKSAMNSFQVTVKEVNVAPVPPVIGPQTINELLTLRVTNTATEANIHSVVTNYTIVSPLTGMTIDTNGIFTWAPAQTQSPGNYTVTIVTANTNAFDTNNPVLKVTNSFTVAVKEVNVAPVLPIVGPQTINELLTLTVPDTATESNIHSIMTNYTIVGPLPGMNISSNGIFTWTPQQAQSPGNYTVTVVAANTNAFDTNNPVLKATNSFSVAVNEVNVAPVPPIIGPQTINELLTLTVTNTATEANVHSIVTNYTIVSPLNGMNIDTNGIFTWAPQQAQSPGNYTVTIVVANTNAFDTNNPVLMATNSFTVAVKEVNVAPVLPIVGPQTINELLTLTVTNTATEANIHSIVTNYLIVGPLNGMNIDTNGIFTWAPQQTQSPGNYTVTIVAANTNAFDTNNPILKATNSFTVAVKEVNVAPVLPIIGPQTINELLTLTVTNTATEANIHSVVTNYTIVSPLNGMNIDTNGIFTWAPQQTQSPGNYTVTIVAANTNAFDTNNPVLMATNSFTVAVKEVNVAPVLPVIAPQTVGQNLTLTVTDTATEPNIHSVTTGYGIVGPLTGMNIDSNGIFTWTTPPSQSPGNYNVTIVVQNTNAFDTNNPVLMASSSFQVTVREINIAPVLPVIGPQTINELLTLTVTNTATEANPHSIVTNYMIVGPLNGMNIDTNGIFTWAPQQTQSPGNYTVTIVAANTNAFDTINPVLTATNSFTVAVKEVNVAPVPPVIGPQTINELLTLTVTNTATEANIHSVVTNYTIVGALNGMNIDTNGIFTWAPQQTQSPGNYTVTVVVANTNAFDTNNPVLMATNSFTVAVKEVNVAPVLPVVGPQTIGEKLTLTITNTATEPNIHSVTTGYSIVTPLTGMNIDSNGIFTWATHQSQSPGNYTVNIVAANTNAFDTNNPVLMTTNSFTVAVKEINVAPVPPVIGPQTINELLTLTVTNTVTETNIHSVTTGYTLIAPQSGMNIDSNGIFTWAPQQAQSPGNYTVTVVAANTNAFDTNNPVLTATNSFSVAVKEVNVAPVLPVIGPQNIGEKLLLTVTNTASEPNIHSVTTGYGIVAPLNGMNIDSNGIFTWSPHQSQSPGSYTVTVVAMNSNTFDTVNPVLTASNSFQVTVQEINVAPIMPVIGPQTINELLTLTVTNTATETNIHSVTTGYTLIAPQSGMNVDSNGIFTWTPQQTQSPGNYTVTIAAANTNAFDTNNPVLTSSNSFTVAVKEVNVAPVLPIVSQQTVAAQTPLTVTNTASEPNIHAVTTGYGLVSPLTGMNIDSNGLFTWTPNLSAGNYTVTVVATNNDTFDTVNPTLTTTNSFAVVVTTSSNTPPPLKIQSVTLSNGVIVIAWNSVVNQKYQVQYKADFTTTNWLVLGANITATNTLTTATDPSGNLQRFYRIAQLAAPSNQPPVLPGQSNLTVNVGTPITVTNTATDPDGDSLTYQLTNSPAGAVISSSGIITWTPTSAGTNTITTIVTDNGTPPLSAMNSFVVTVNPVVTNPPPAIQSIVASGGNIVLTWSAVSGGNYQVQYKTNITDATWTPIVPNLTASGSTLSLTNAIGSAQQEFFRLVVLP